MMIGRLSKFLAAVLVKRSEKRRLQSEASFTLIETVIALALVTFLILEVSAVQGNSIVFSDYGRNVTQASWLARRVLSEIEYYAQTKPFKELQQTITDQRFEDFEDYSYSIDIKEWKFPITQLLTGDLLGSGQEDADAGDSSDDEKPDDPGAASPDMIEQAIKQIFGDEPLFMTARVDVSWAEGAQRNSTGLTYLLTNQVKLDEFIATLKPEYDKATRPSPRPGARPQAPGGPQGSEGGPQGPGGPQGAPGQTNGTTPIPPPPQPPPE